MKIETKVILLSGMLLVLGILSGCVIPIPTVQPLTKIDPVQETQVVSLNGATRATVRLRLLSEALTVKSNPAIDFFAGNFAYNVQEWSPKIDQQASEDDLHLTVSQGLGSQIPIGLGEDYDNAWDIGLKPGIPLDLVVDMGTGTADLDLTGLSMSKLALTTGKTDVSVAFNAPNPEPLLMLRLTAGAGNTVMTGLGNANFDELNIIGGTGSLDLDFSGSLTRSAVVDVKAGAGEFNVRVPAIVGVRVTVIGTPISTIRTTGFTEEVENIYYNDAYGDVSLTLVIKITTGVGKVSLISQ